MVVILCKQKWEVGRVKPVRKTVVYRRAAGIST